MTQTNNNANLWEFFNPNPNFKDFKVVKNNKHKRCTTTDCAIRAVCGCFDIDWFKSFDMLTESARKVCDVTNSCAAMDDAMERSGFTKVSIKAEKGTKRPTIASFAKEHPKGNYILHVAGHFCCVKNGKYYDAWDSGECSLYGYYEQHK